MKKEVLKEEDASRILKEQKTPEDVIEHSNAVSSYAYELAQKAESNGHKVDSEFVKVAALLHDIGRSKTHTVEHTVEGAKILSDYPHYARICTTHIGAGLGKTEAENLGLPAGDYMPKTLEEKIIAYADKRTDGTQHTSIEDALKKYGNRLGKEHPTVERIKKLHEEIKSLTS